MSKSYFVVAMPGSWAVACRDWRGKLYAISEHGTRKSAENEATRKNHEARVAAIRAYWRQNTIPKKRRPVRYFEDDAFA